MNWTATRKKKKRKIPEIKGGNEEKKTGMELFKFVFSMPPKRKSMSKKSEEKEGDIVPRGQDRVHVVPGINGEKKQGDGTDDEKRLPIEIVVDQIEKLDILIMHTENNLKQLQEVKRQLKTAKRGREQSYIKYLKKYIAEQKLISPCRVSYHGIFSSLIREKNYKNCAEIGVTYGFHALQVLSSTDLDHLYLVDPYRYEKGHVFSATIEAITPARNPQTVLDHFFEIVRDKLSSRISNTRYTFVRKSSSDGARKIPDGSLDAVFVNNDKRYEMVLKDLSTWWPKIRGGGALLGTDYLEPQVARATREFAEKHHLRVESKSLYGNTYKIWHIEKSPDTKTESAVPSSSSSISVAQVKGPQKFVRPSNAKELTEFLKSIAFTHRGRQIVAFTNANCWYIDSLVLNLWKSWQRSAHGRPFGVICTDSAGFEIATKLGMDTSMLLQIPALGVDKMLKNTIYSSRGYKRLCYVKHVILSHALRHKYTVVYLDPDTVLNTTVTDLLDDILPIPYSAMFQHHGLYKDAISTGIMRFFPGPLWKRIRLRLDEMHAIDTYESDEPWIVERILQSEYGLLPEMTYPCGNIAESCRDIAKVVHANYVNGKEAKIRLLKTLGLWMVADPVGIPLPPLIPTEEKKDPPATTPPQR